MELEITVQLQQVVLHVLKEIFVQEQEKYHQQFVIKESIVKEREIQLLLETVKLDIIVQQEVHLQRKKIVQQVHIVHWVQEIILFVQVEAIVH